MKDCLLCHGGSQTRGVPGHIVRAALHREAALNRDLEQAPNYRWPSTNTVLDGAAKAVVECFLFCDASRTSRPTTGGRTGQSHGAVGGPVERHGIPPGLELRLESLGGAKWDAVFQGRRGGAGNGGSLHVGF